jgi:hypothetical protein
LRRQEQSEIRTRGKRARRCIVERVASWLNRYRGTLVRLEKKVANYEVLRHYAFAPISWRTPIRLWGKFQIACAYSRPDDATGQPWAILWRKKLAFFSRRRAPIDQTSL